MPFDRGMNDPASGISRLRETNAMGKHFLILLACLAAAVIPALPAFAGEEVPAIEDDEEYRVYAAVLFPNKPEIPDAIKDDPLRRDLYLSERPRLDGLGLGNGDAVVDEQTTGSQKRRPPEDGTDDPMGADFNRKNEKPARLLMGKLMAHLPKNQSIHIITVEERNKLLRARDGWDQFRQKFPFAGGIKTFSRVGFDPARARAVVFIHHQAHYRMGVGYLIFLDKSATSGKWIIAGAFPTRIS
jgi:hypothetical protein